MQPFRWEIGKWLCEIQDTPQGPLCTFSVKISASTITEWNKFSQQLKKIREIVKKAGIPPNSTPHYNITAMNKMIIVIATGWKKTVPTNVIFEKAKKMINGFQELACKWGVKLEKIEIPNK